MNGIQQMRPIAVPTKSTQGIPDQAIRCDTVVATKHPVGHKALAFLKIVLEKSLGSDGTVFFNGLRGIVKCFVEANHIQIQFDFIQRHIFGLIPTTL